MNTLGKSDLNVSEISFGCMSLSENQAQADALLHKAYDRGINFFDTADLYDKGMNELHVGTALKSMRQKVVIATKVGNQWRPDGSGWDWNPSKEYILKSVEQSLRRLQTDYIDLYQLHGGTIDDPIEETIAAFEQLKEQGKIRWYGISSIRPNVIREYVKNSNIVSVMMQYSLLDNRPEEEILALLNEHQISVITRGAVAQGRLLGKKEGAYLQFTSSEVTKAAKNIGKLADDLNKQKIDVALAYVLSQPAVASAVTGIRTAEQLDEATKALKEWPQLTEDQLVELRQQVRTFTYDAHR
ncbi:aldo/keto reductase [Olivibacter domesticus]|uniref:Predicted oxidoreductase n=1 Tax=Olivibacter domesticus TaxID=407022 RepID=A0A1H7Q254_OLID1|nr:aldo/keto reductase [Olivibacter domesticus]SEL41889.1 Predicted oxidoreductase [Olivibacter domesticus]